ncbi:hypothetical protein ABK040_013692 [Willaertia magna]
MKSQVRKHRPAQFIKFNGSIKNHTNLILLQEIEKESINRNNVEQEVVIEANEGELIEANVKEVLKANKDNDQPKDNQENPLEDSLLEKGNDNDENNIKINYAPSFKAKVENEKLVDEGL